MHFDFFQFVTGRLSIRMRQPGGVWREAWSAAEPVPAHRQKRLFDDTREAEKVLHYLAGLKTAELGLLVLPVLTHCSIQALREKHGECVSVCVRESVCVCVAHCLLFQPCSLCPCRRVTSTTPSLSSPPSLTPPSTAYPSTRRSSPSSLRQNTCRYI